VEQEWLNANGQLANELTNANEFVRDLEYKKSQVEQKLVDEQVFNFIKKCIANILENSKRCICAN